MSTYVCVYIVCKCVYTHTCTFISFFFHVLNFSVSASQLYFILVFPGPGFLRRITIAQAPGPSVKSSFTTLYYTVAVSC